MRISKKNLQRRLDNYASNGFPKRFKRLGQGSFRTAYYDPQTKLVFKTGERYDNLTEWLIWNALPTKCRKLFARVYGISQSGTVIAMQYIPMEVPVPPQRTYNYMPRERMSDILCSIGLDVIRDIHEDNMRLTKGHYAKIVDYGITCFGNLRRNSLKTLKRDLKSRLKKHRLDQHLARNRMR